MPIYLNSLNQTFFLNPKHDMSWSNEPIPIKIWKLFLKNDLFHPLSRDLSRGFWPKEGPKLKDKYFEFSANLIIFLKRPGNSIISSAWPNQTYSPVLSYWLTFCIHKLSANRRVGLVWPCTRNYTIARPLLFFAYLQNPSLEALRF